MRIRLLCLALVAMSVIALGASGSVAARAARPGPPVLRHELGRSLGQALGSSKDSGIFSMNADGSGQTNLNNSVLDESPSWSPAGTKIAFVRWGELGAEIYVMNDERGREQPEESDERSRGRRMADLVARQRVHRAREVRFLD